MAAILVFKPPWGSGDMAWWGYGWGRRWRAGWKWWRYAPVEPSEQRESETPAPPPYWGPPYWYPWPPPLPWPWYRPPLSPEEELEMLEDYKRALEEELREIEEELRGVEARIKELREMLGKKKP